MKSSKMRLQSLDSLRGVAALIVVVYHSTLILPGGGEDRRMLLAEGFRAPLAWLYLTPLRLLVAGPAAVLLFFVLSGVVLAMSFVERGRVRYLPFTIKRIARIWLPFALVILGAALLTHLLPLGPITGASGWFANSWQHPASLPSLSAHLLMTGTASDLDDPMWSLVHEMRVSLIFPVLAGLTLRDWRVMLVGTMAGSLICARAASLAGWSGIELSFLSTGIYLFLFVAGIAIAREMPTLRRHLAGLPASATVGLWIAALGGVCLCPVQTAVVRRTPDDLALLASGLSAAVIVLLCAVEGRAFQALVGRLPSYLGRISYSLYLLHVVVLVAIIRSLHGLLPLPVLIVLGIVLSIGLADLCQRYVEVPTTELGREWARRLAPRRHVAGSD